MKYLAPILVVVGLLFSALPAAPHDTHNPAHDDWYRDLKQPDNPAQSCCGLADAYWADEVHVKDGKTYVVIQDDRDNNLLGRPPIPNGTWVLVPNHKLKYDAGNPTGHGVVFMRGPHTVFCYVFGQLS